MKVTLIYPRYKYENVGNEQEPLGIMSIATVLKNENYPVAFYDLTFAKDLSILKTDVLDSGLVGFSSSSPLFGVAKQVLAYIKSLNPEVLTAVGGPHPTQDPQDALDAGFDFAVIGEGERVILELVRGLEAGSWKDVKGIAYKEGGNIKINQPQVFIQDLNTLPLIDRSLIDYSRYFAFGMIASRGCPFNCFYCKPMLDKLFGQGLRRRNVVSIVDEIESLHKLNKNKVIYFRDDTFTINSSGWFREFNRELKKRELKVKWGANARVDTVDKEKLELMKGSGCEGLSFGVESGSQKIIDFYKKGTKINQVAEAFSLCRKLKIQTLAYLMVGAPIETREDLEMTYQLVRKIKPTLWAIFVTTPFPGNSLFEYAKERRIITIRDYAEYDNAQNSKFLNLPMKLDYLSKEDIEEYRDKINHFMIRQAIFSRFLGVVTRPSEFRKLILDFPKAINLVKTLLSRYEKR